MSDSNVAQSGHPRGLYTLFFSEMWERFCYYGMRVLLTLYLVKSLMKGDAEAALIYGALLYFAQGIAAKGFDTALTVFVTLFVVGWIIQFVGHIFEKRKPALFDNLLQIFMAPSFLIAEVLFLIGLEKGLRAEIDARIEKYLPQKS